MKNVLWLLALVIFGAAPAWGDSKDAEEKTILYAAPSCTAYYVTVVGALGGEVRRTDVACQIACPHHMIAKCSSTRGGNPGSASCACTNTK